MNISNKLELYKELATRTNMTQKKIEEIHESFLDLVDEVFMSQEEAHIHIPGIGKLRVANTKSRNYTNPFTNVKTVIPTKRRVSLTPYTTFKEQYTELMPKQLEDKKE